MQSKYMGGKMSKIKNYAVKLMGEDGFEEYLDKQMEGAKNGKSKSNQ